MLHFENVYWLALGLVIPLLIVLYRRNRAFVRQAQERFASSLRASWIEGYVPGVAFRRFFLFSVAIGLLVLALANPRMGLRSQSVQRRGIDVFLAMDVSRSMRAQDLKPSRMERSKQLAFQLLETFRGDRVGMVFFAGKAFLQMPLTTDYAAAELFIRTASPEWEIEQGTAIEEAIDLVSKLSEGQTSQRERALIFLTDGENHEQRAIDAAREAREKGIYTFILAVGTAEGANIPDPQTGGNVTDKQGQTVLSRLNETLMSEVAQAGGGVLVKATEGRSALRELHEATQKIQAQAFEEEQFDVFETYFQWLLAPAILLLLIEANLSYRSREKKAKKDKKHKLKASAPSKAEG